PEKIRTIELKPTTLERLHEALADVVKEAGGTGGAARSTLVEDAGKKGTAQVVEMKGGYGKNQETAHFNHRHAWFVSYAPVQNPQIAVVVLESTEGTAATRQRRWPKK